MSAVTEELGEMIREFPAVPPSIRRMAWKRIMVLFAKFTLEVHDQEPKTHPAFLADLTDQQRRDWIDARIAAEQTNTPKEG